MGWWYRTVIVHHRFILKPSPCGIRGKPYVTKLNLWDDKILSGFIFKNHDLARWSSPSLDHLILFIVREFIEPVEVFALRYQYYISLLYPFIQFSGCPCPEIATLMCHQLSKLCFVWQWFGSKIVAPLLHCN